MTSVIQHKRRIIPGTGGAPTGGAEGEIALNFKDGVGKKPEVWANGGSVIGWCQINPDVAVTVGSVVLPGGTTGSPTGIGAAWTALTPKPTSSITIAKFAGTAYVLTGAGAADTDWTPLGAATAFASAAEILAGTDGSKAINPIGLQSRTINTPSATPASDHDKIPVLDATGKIAAGFLPIGGLTFSGTLDPTIAYAAPTPAPTNGQFFSVGKDGAVHASWASHFANSGLTQVKAGDFMVWDATASKFHHIANAIDMSAYVPLAGTTAMTGNIVWGGAAANKAGTIIFSGKSGTIDDVTIDGGVY